MKPEEKIGKIRDIVNDDEERGDMHMVVLHRGWIFVGQLGYDAGKYVLRNVENVRKWESGGFGGLTRGAKSSGATLDKCEDLRFDAEAMIFDCLLNRGWRDA